MTAPRAGGVAARSGAEAVALELDVQYATGSLAGLPARRSIESWVRAALAGRRRGAQLAVRIVAEAEGRALNERYRRRAGPTNVLSFPFEPSGRMRPPPLGDIVLCAPVVQREAAEQGKPARAHWAHLVVHGVLHLLGHDHENSREAEHMEELERKILARLGYPDPYASERAAMRQNSKRQALTNERS
ncbi:MAG: rRNA maturation RNase YbeY [Gammaproteobacteria bacterium]|nr:rRNA maturation RNase YbeY [Gammaproteobacteria bacterium]